LLNGFIGEFLILSGTFTGVSRGWAIAATVTIILGAVYVLWLVQRVFYGPESPMAATEPAADLRANEWVALVPLAALMLAMGVVPNVWMQAIEHFEGPVHVQQAGNSNAPQLRVTISAAPPAEAK
jgi:NADH-quinone oxidoreductase subunit M